MVNFPVSGLQSAWHIFSFISFFQTLLYVTLFAYAHISAIYFWPGFLAAAGILGFCLWIVYKKKQRSVKKAEFPLGTLVALAYIYGMQTFRIVQEQSAAFNTVHDAGRCFTLLGQGLAKLYWSALLGAVVAGLAISALRFGIEWFAKRRKNG